MLHFSTSKEVKVDRGDPKRFNLVQRKVDKAQKVAPSIREDLNKQLSHFDDLGHVNIFENKRLSPDTVVKEIDSSFESFFHQRPYNQHNFNFYLQVLAQQEHPDLAMKAFDRMIAMQIQPNDETFTQLMLAHAKRKMLAKVLELEKTASETYGIPPSQNRLNSIILAYSKTGQPWKAEALIEEMREKLGMQPDVVCYTTLIHGYARANKLDKCWELYKECSERRQPG